MRQGVLKGMLPVNKVCCNKSFLLVVIFIGVNETGIETDPSVLSPVISTKVRVARVNSSL